MVIVTYNMQNGGSPDMLQWAHVIEAFDPDVLLAQESCDPRRYRLSKGSDGGAWESRTAWRPVPERTTQVWGSGVYVKSGTASLLRLDDAFQGWLAGAEIDSCAAASGRRLRVFSLHAPAPYTTSVERMLDVVWANRGDADIILGGDFNLTIGERHHTERNDDGTRWTTKPDERAIQARLRDQFGLVNCWQAANPGVPLAQTLRWSGEPRPVRNPLCPPVRSFHVDGIFVPATWGFPRCTVVSNEEWTGRNDGNRLPRSDHNPVVVSVGVPEGD